MPENPLIDLTPDNANEDLFDASIRHQVGIRRFTGGEVKRVLGILEKADRELTSKLRRRLRFLAGKAADFTTQRFKSLLKDVRAARKVAFKAVRQSTRKNLLALAKLEINFEEKIFQASIPVEVTFGTVQLAKLRSVVLRQAFQGRLLSNWFNTVARADQSRLLQQLQLGLTQQETVGQMVRRVVGTRANGFRDGVLSTTRREATAIVRTSINHVSNGAREEFWKGNEDIIQGLRWSSTLDGRTTPICRSRDGKFASVGDKSLPSGFPPLEPALARPPAHVSCRSVMVAVLDSDGIADSLPERPFVRDTRTGKRRQLDFAKTAREMGRTTRQVSRAWASRNIGRLPGTIDYNTFLRRQPLKFQQDVLGKTKADLFRKGKLNMDEFVDSRGKELTLTQLSRTKPQAFVRAGLKPGDF